MNPHSSEARFRNEDFAHDGQGPRGLWSRAAEEALGAGAMIGAALAIDALERPWRERRARERAEDRDGVGAPARSREPYVGSPRFLWTSIAALALMSRARRDAAGLRTAAKLALAVAAAQGVARVTGSWAAHRGSPSSGRRIFSERSAAAWAAAGVLERVQGKGPGLAAYGAAALAGYPRPSGRSRPVADAVAGAVVGRAIGRLVGQIRLA